MALTVDTSMIIGDLLDVAPEVEPILKSVGMHCLQCPCSRGESIGAAAMVHGHDPEVLVAKINAFLAAQD